MSRFFFCFATTPGFPSLTFRSFPLLSCLSRRSLEGNAALSEAKTDALAEEFHISPREVLAVVEHFKMKAEAVASPAKRAAAAVEGANPLESLVFDPWCYEETRSGKVLVGEEAETTAS